MLANLRAGKITQGGSTLTQQLVKNFFLTPERTLAAQAAAKPCMALIVEARYDKNAILEAYLNEIYLGQRGSPRCTASARPPISISESPRASSSVAESALLAAIIQSPNGISPYRDPERALRAAQPRARADAEQGRLDAADVRAGARGAAAGRDA